MADVPDCGPDCGPGCDCGKYTELGNDVFMQYEKHKDGHLTPLKQKNVDTGWGLERILAFLNGTKDVYRTDLFTSAISFIEKESGTEYEKDEKLTRSMRILADHMRTSVMLIGDAAKLVPSNVGAGYVLRRLIRRAVRHGRTLGLGKDKLLDIAKLYIDEVYGESYPLLIKNRDFIISELDKEIVRFESTLENGMKEFKKILDSVKSSDADKMTISGENAFYLYDSFGFPLELTVEMASEEGIDVDEEGFDVAMEAAKKKARENQNFSQSLSADAGLFDDLDIPETLFTGYDRLQDESEIKALSVENEVTEGLKEGDRGTVVVLKTPFYATMGGQCGDSGVITAPDGEFIVQDTIKVVGGKIAHVGYVSKGSIRLGDEVKLNVDENQRALTCKNHSATHLLQKALRLVLGDHVEQKGSYVDPDRLRFDFTHFQSVTKEELQKVEDLVNEKIAENIPVITDVMTIEEAKKTGAMALFGEKYGEKVRVVSMGEFSKEFCGGTHVASTGNIRLFKIVSESGVAAGVRRIEALTDKGVLEYYANLEDEIAKAASAAKVDVSMLVTRINALNDEVKALSNENEKLKAQLANNALGDVSKDAKEVKGFKLIATKVSNVDMNELRNLGDKLKAEVGSGVVLLASDVNGKVNLIAMATDDAIGAGAHAGNLIKALAPIVGGGGGGRPNMAQAGGKNPAGIDELLEKSATVLEEQLD